MTLKEQAQKFIEQVKAGNVGEAMETAAEILKASAGFYKLIFGGSVAAVTMTEEDLTAEEAELTGLRYDLTEPIATSAVKPTVDPVLVLTLIDIVLKLIAERRKQK